jgi:hypothetical protein
MRIVVDEETFDELQLELKNSLGKSILALLDEANVEPGVADRLCDAILFDITAQIDGEHGPLMYKGRAASPVLLFVLADAPGKLMAASEEGSSWMHEYAMGTSENIRRGSI